MFGNPTTTQGGHALKFYSDVRIEVSKSLNKEGDVTVGNLTKVKSVKNKMFPPYKLATFQVKFGVGIDKLDELLNLADDFKIVKKWGKTITYNETKYDVEEFNTLLMDNDEFYNSIKNEIVSKINSTEILEEETVEHED